MAELLTEQELKSLCQTPEWQTLERKSVRIHPRDLANTLIAFAVLLTFSPFMVIASHFGDCSPVLAGVKGRFALHP